MDDLINNQDLDIIGFEAIDTAFLLQRNSTEEQNLNEKIKEKLEKLKVIILP